jgi:xylan 1,4-beta-xylosidase
LLSAYGYSASNTYLTEWNASPSHRDLSHDTLFMASYLVKSILGNVEKTQSFGFWTLSDDIEEFPLPSATFHGGMGLVTFNGIKKPGYFAFQLLNSLGDEKIASGPGYFITRSESGIQVMLYNYCHYDPLYCSMDHSAMTHIDRYGIFKNSDSKNYQFNLHGFIESEYEILEYSINRTHGSAFDTWVDMGAPESLDAEDIRYLTQKAVPSRKRTIEVIKKSYSLNRCLAPHEVRLIMISPKNA